MEKVPMTVAGERTLRERLKHMKEIERHQVVRAIEEARAHGDLSENAEYHSAREKQGILEAQIRDLEDRLGRAEVIDTSKLGGDRVVFGATVVLEDGESGEQVTYRIVGTEEADPKAGRISYTSPLARAIIGKGEGDLVQFRAPAGAREYEVIEIRFE